MSNQRTVGTQGSFWTGVVGFLLCLGLGGAMGAWRTAGQFTDDSSFDEVTMTNHLVTTSGNGGFNWLFFSIFLAVGILFFAICYAAATVATAIDNQAIEVVETDDVATSGA